MTPASEKSHTLYLLAARIIIFFGFLAGIWLAFEYALPILLPFLLAWLLSLAVRPLVNRLAGKKRLLRGLMTGLLVLLFSGLVIFGIIKGCGRAVGELGRLMEGMSQDGSGISGFFEELNGWTTSLSDHLPFLDRFSEHPNFQAFCDALDQAVRTGAQTALDTLGERVPTLLMSVVGQLPSVLIFVTSLLLSCYYFSADSQTAGEQLGKILPIEWQAGYDGWREKLKRALTRYIKAYVILGLLTFGEMFLGLSILKMPYAFLLAWVIALVDFLPLLGAGTVLVPWALVCLIMGKGGLATGLLVIFGIHTLLRQILEPRLLSRELGLHPLASLVAVYAGWFLFGVGGMLVAPLVLLVFKELLWGKRTAVSTDFSVNTRS